MFFVSWILGLCTILVFTSNLGINFSKITLPGILLLFIIIFQYLGFPILYFRLDNYRAEFVTDQEILLKTYFINFLCIFFLLLGNWIAGLSSQAFSNSKRRACDKSSHSRLTGGQRAVIWLIGAVCLIALIAYVSKVGFFNLAIMAAIGIAADISPELARSQMTNALAGGGYGWYQLFMQKLMLFIYLIFLAEFLRGEKRAMLGTLFFGCALSFSLLMTGEKGLIAFAILASFFVHAIIRARGRIVTRLTAAVTIALVFGLAFLYSISYGGRDIFSSISLVASRTLTGSLQASYHYVEVFPIQEGFLLGMSFPNPGGILPFEPYLLTQKMIDFVDPATSSRGVVGSMPTIFWGEMYANFSILGVVVSSVFVGFMLSMANFLVCRMAGGSIGVALFSWLTVHYANLSITGLTPFILDPPLWIVCSTAILLRLLGAYRRRPWITS